MPAGQKQRGRPFGFLPAWGGACRNSRMCAEMSLLLVSVSGRARVCLHRLHTCRWKASIASLLKRKTEKKKKKEMFALALNLLIRVFFWCSWAESEGRGKQRQVKHKTPSEDGMRGIRDGNRSNTERENLVCHVSHVWLLELMSSN